MAPIKLILVTGESGQQGGAVARSLLRQGQRVRVLTRNPVRFLLVSGPLHKSIARYGPFVMNTKEEIEETLLELSRETFVTT